MFRAYKRYYGVIKTHKLQWVLFFIVDLWFLLFLLVATFRIITLPTFSASYMHMDPAYAVECHLWPFFKGRLTGEGKWLWL